MKLDCELPDREPEPECPQKLKRDPVSVVALIGGVAILFALAYLFESGQISLEFRYL